MKKVIGFVLLGIGMLLLMSASMNGMRADVPPEDRPWRMLGGLTCVAIFLIPGFLLLWSASRDRRRRSQLPPPRAFMADEPDAPRPAQPDDRIALPPDDRTTRQPGPDGP